MYPHTVAVKIRDDIWCFDPVDGDRMAWDLRGWLAATMDGSWNVYLEWCRDLKARVVIFRFELESDAVAFKLRWV